MDKDLIERALRTIENCNNPEMLQQIMRNATERGATEVRDAAFRRLCTVKPSAEPGTLEHAVWRSVFALEEALKAERKKTTLLGRTRQKIGRDGEQKTVADLVLKAASSGFDMLIERGMPELTFEAVALQFPDRFDAAVLKAAQSRLAGIPLDSYAAPV